MQIYILKVCIYMALEALSLLALFTVTIIIGYIGAFIFRKTRISDVIWLILLGLILGPWLGWIDRVVFIAVLPLLSALALILILFDAGLNMDFYKMIKGFSRGSVLAVLGVGFSMISIAAASMFLLKFNLLEGLLLGSILGGISSASVIAMTEKMKSIRSEIKTILTLESIITDPLTIVIPIALIGILASPGTEVSALGPISTIISTFSIGAVLGILGGIFWQLISDRLKEKKLNYMLTLAAVFIVYILVESVNGSGAIASLLFGLMLGNRRIFYNLLKVKKRSRGDHEDLKLVQTEVSFFIRSFFFVYLGLIATINTDFLIYGLIITGILVVIRLVFVELSVIKMDLRSQEKNMIRIMAPRGLAAAVVSQIPLTIGLSAGAAIFNISFVVILGTTVYTTIAVFVFSREKKSVKTKKKL